MRVFDKANQNLLGIILFERYMESYFEKEVKMDQTKLYQADLDSLLAKSFPTVVSALSYLALTFFLAVGFSCGSNGGPIQL